MASEDLILRMRAAGTSAFVGSVHAGAAAVEETAKAGGRATRSLKNAASAMSRFAQRGALGLGGVAAAAVGFGLKFNASMEQSQVAFTNLLGSGAKAHAMLDQLYALAAKTPFEFPELVKSTQMLLGFGMAADKVVPTMKAIGDAVSAAGGGSEQISVITRAFGQMQAKGKTSLEEINQMAEGGVPALKLMADQMHMSTGRLQKEISAGHVSAQKGIDALVAGIQKRYKGMSAAQSKTFAGQISTLKDYANQAAGALTQPLFTWMRNKALPRATHFAQDITNIMSSHVLTTSGKEAAIQASFERWFSPLGRVLQRTIAAANIPEKLGRAFRSAMPRVADAMAAGAPVALNAFWGAFSSMGGGGQALTVAFLATKFGLTGGILRRLGSWAFGRFRGGFRGGLGGGQLATGVMTVRAGVVNVNGAGVGPGAVGKGAARGAAAAAAADLAIAALPIALPALAAAGAAYAATLPTKGPKAAQSGNPESVRSQGPRLPPGQSWWEQHHEPKGQRLTEANTRAYAGYKGVPETAKAAKAAADGAKRAADKAASAASDAAHAASAAKDFAANMPAPIVQIDGRTVASAVRRESNKDKSKR